MDIREQGREDIDFVWYRTLLNCAPRCIMTERLGIGDCLFRNGRSGPQQAGSQQEY